MLNDLLAITHAGEFEDNGLIRVLHVARRENMLDILIELDFQDDALRQQWQITCVKPRAQQLRFNIASSLTVSNNHVLLWPHKQPSTQVYFSGTNSNPLSVLGALYQRHTALVDTWIPFERFFNPLVELPALLAGPAGMLADGPESLVLAYEEILHQYGYQASHVASRPPRYWDGLRWVEEDTDLKVLLLDTSFVVAADFQVNKASHTGDERK